MPRIIKELPSFQAVNGGQTAICNLPLGMTYHQILLRYQADEGAGVVDATEAVFKDDLTEIRLIVDGDTKVQLSGTELVGLLEYYGLTIEDGVLPVLFSRPWQRTMEGEDELAYGTADVQTMSLEVDIKAGTTSPSLTGFAVKGPNAPLGRHLAIRRYGQTYAGAAGEFEISDIPRGPYAQLATHFTTDKVSRVEVEANQRIVYEADTQIAKAYFAQTARVLQTGFTHVDFAATNRLGDALPLNLQDFRYRLTMTGAEPSFKAIVERVEGVAAAR